MATQRKYFWVAEVPLMAVSFAVLAFAFTAASPIYVRIGALIYVIALLKALVWASGEVYSDWNDSLVGPTGTLGFAFRRVHVHLGTAFLIALGIIGVLGLLGMAALTGYDFIKNGNMALADYLDVRELPGEAQLIIVAIALELGLILAIPDILER